MNAGQIIVIGLSLALALWFAGGIWYNRRRARQIWRWLEPGLKVFSGRVGEPWMGSSGAGLRVVVQHPLPRVRRLEVIARLESRENLPLWLAELAQGKRDQLTLRAWLRSTSRGQVEAVPAGSGIERALLTETDQPWQRREASPGWVIAQRGDVREEQLAALREFVAAYDRQLQRFSQGRSEPQLYVQMRLDRLIDGSSRQLMNQLKATLTA